MFGRKQERGRHFPDDDIVAELASRRITEGIRSAQKIVRTFVLCAMVITGAVVWMAVMFTAAFMEYKLR